MKQRIVLLSLVFALSGMTAFAAEPLNEKVLATFNKTFSNAKLVNWSEVSGLFKASFVLGDHRAEAYFNAEGDMEGCIRDLFYVQLPLVVMTSIDRRFPDAAVLDVREIINTEGTTYRVTLESKGKKVRVKADGTGNIFDVEKLKK